MKYIINELENNKNHELNQIGLTPHSSFNGTQEEHDELHRNKANQYEKVIKILSSKFMVRDWMCSETHDFDNFDDAKEFYDERINLCSGGETDVELYAVIEGVNNVD